MKTQERVAVVTLLQAFTSGLGAAPPPPPPPQQQQQQPPPRGPKRLRDERATPRAR